MKSWTCSKTTTFSPGSYHKETKIFTRHHNLKVGMAALSQEVHSRYQEPSSRIPNPGSCFLTLYGFSSAPIHLDQTCSAAFRFPLHTRPLSVSTYSNNSFIANDYHTGPASLPHFSRLSTPRFTIGFHSLRFSSYFSTFSLTKESIIRSNVAYNGSNANDAGHTNTFSTSVGIIEASVNPSSIAYP